jgi:uncharacterized repeat protein (TIGR01451 family)
MRKIILTLSAVLFIGIFSYSQNFISAYTNKTPGCSMGAQNRIVTDNMNNVINSASYNGTVTTNNYSFTSNGGLSTLIVKKDDNDSVIWARNLTCGKVVVVGGLYTDLQSNIYVTGFFGDSTGSSTLNCFPFPLTNTVGVSSFVIKYAPDGTVLWSNSIKVATNTGSINSDLFRITGNGTNRIAISSDFKYVSSQIVGTSTISPSTGNLFYAVIDNNGNWLHASVIGGATNIHISMSIAMAANDDVYMAGVFKGNLNFGGAGTISTLTSSPQDFICKADQSGNFVWAKKLESSSWWRTEVLALNNDVLLIGCFGGTNTLGTTTLTSSSYSTYITKISNAGNFIWAKKYGTNETHFYSATKNNNRIFLSGYTSPYVLSNQFDTLHLTYLTSLPLANTLSCICYMLETDLNGNALQGAFYSFNFPTLNTSDMACTNSKVYLTGNIGSHATFGGHSLVSIVTNASNYVAQYTDSANIISGVTYYDFNSNNLFDSGDINCNTKLSLTKGSEVITTFSNGPYKVGVNKGNYVSTITDSPLYYNYSPISYVSPFLSLSNQIDSLNDFAFQPIAGQNDLVIDLVLGQLRPGFIGVAYVTLKNVGTTTKSGTMDVLLNHSDITISSCFPVALNIVTNSASLSYSLSPTDQIIYLINYYVAVTAPLSSTVIASATASDITDITPINNVDIISASITGSYDPNSKEVNPRGDITPAFIYSGESLEYIINFQNTGNDTAFTVVLRDTISNKLNLNSFELVTSSHPVIVNIYDNEIWFRFYHINLVDSNTNEQMSHGFVKYNITPINSCVIGDIITNKAYIYFDYNTPIKTNTTITQIINIFNLNEENLNIISSVYPNPVYGNYANIKSNNPINSILIYDACGKKVKSVSVDNTLEYAILIDDLTEGIYFVTVITNKGSSMNKLIKFK